MYGSPALDFQFTSTALEQACDASATICDPARGIALATRDCGPSSESASVNACRTEAECTYQWQLDGAMAHSSARSEAAACSRNADTDKWSCACSFDDTAWVTYSFVADTSVGSACGSAFDVCAKFDALVPELGADCELAPVVAGEASCLEAASCRFYASVDGTRISMKLGMNISCAQQSSGVVCYLETDQETMEVAAPSENASEACAAFTSDDLVGLVSLPASSH
jgi:hypothetical protein